MPFTPYHMGPGILIKAILQGSFSLMVFGWAQVLMDVQPLVAMITRRGHFHGWSHTFLGATLIALIAALSGKYLSEFFLNWFVDKQTNKIRIVWWVAFLSAFIGAYSHVVIDGIMHSDVRPFYPFSTVKHINHIISVSALHQFLLYSGIAGGVLYFAVKFFLAWRSKRKGSLDSSHTF